MRPILLFAASIVGATYPAVVIGQVAIAPASVSYVQSVTRGSGDRGPDASTTDEPQPRDFFQGTGLSGALGKFGQLAVATKPLRIGLYGTPDCKEQSGKTICVKRVVYQLDLDSQIIDPMNRSISALKQYVLSDKGSPLSLHLPSIKLPWFLGALNFNTVKDPKIPQPWAAGALAATARYIPVRDTSGSIFSGASFGAQYALEAHLWANIGGVDGTAFGMVAPSINYVVGNPLRDQITEGPGRVSRVMGLSYQAGYQFGTSNAVSISGTYSFTSLREGRKQLAVAFGRTLGALGTRK